MKFIFFTDVHARANNPISRLDDFPNTVLDKLKWVVDTANSENAVILMGGDWLNRPDTSPSLIGAISRVLSKANNEILTVLGNHDIYGYNKDTFQRTPMYILECFESIKLLSEDTPYIFDTENGPIKIYGAHASYDIDKVDKKHYLLSDVEKDGLIIHVVHGFLTNKPWPMVEHTLIDDILDTKADIILSGHEHSGYGLVRKGDKVFCNPGALLRVTAGIGDINMSVRVAMIDTDKNHVNFIECPIARPSEEVLDRDKLLAEKQHEEQMQKFYESIKEIDMSLIENTDIIEIFKVFSNSEDLEKTVEEEVIKRLREATEKVSILGWDDDEKV